MTRTRLAARTVRETVRKAKKLVRLLRSPAYLRALRHGVAAAIEHERVPFAHDFTTIVDAGAGRGQFALVARRRFPSAMLHCFEPLPSSRATLTAVMAGDSHVEIRAVALGASSGRARLHVARSADSSSLLRATERLTSSTPGTDQPGRVEVEVARLDQVLKAAELRPPALLKIDVQGVELDVLLGTGELLARFDELLVECSFVELYDGQPRASDIVVELHRRGFGLVGVFSVSSDNAGRCLQADFLFVRD